MPALLAVDSMQVPLESPPLRYSEGRTARRASPEENPHNAFITRCEVPGASDGPLAGKTVGLKDHTAVPVFR